MGDVTKWMEKLSCPECGEVGTIRKMLWGYPTREVLVSGDFVLGGCIVFGGEPKHGCQKCSWTGNYIKGQLISHDLESED